VPRDDMPPEPLTPTSGCYPFPRTARTLAGEAPGPVPTSLHAPAIGICAA
jgi:hypothetical protein